MYIRSVISFFFIQSSLFIYSNKSNFFLDILSFWDSKPLECKLMKVIIGPYIVQEQ